MCLASICMHGMFGCCEYRLSDMQLLQFQSDSWFNLSWMECCCCRKSQSESAENAYLPDMVASLTSQRTNVFDSFESRCTWYVRGTLDATQGTTDEFSKASNNVMFMFSSQIQCSIFFCCWIICHLYIFFCSDSLTGTYECHGHSNVEAVWKPNQQFCSGTERFETACRKCYSTKDVLCYVMLVLWLFDIALFCI